MNIIFINLRVRPSTVIALADGVLCFSAREPDSNFSLPVRIESAQLVDEFAKSSKIDLDEKGSFQVKEGFSFYGAGSLREIEFLDPQGGPGELHLGVFLHWIEQSSITQGGA